MIKRNLLAWKVVLPSLDGFVEVLHRLGLLFVSHGGVVVYTSRCEIVKTRREEPNGARNDIHAVIADNLCRGIEVTLFSGTLTPFFYNWYIYIGPKVRCSNDVKLSVLGFREHILIYFFRVLVLLNF